MKEITFFKIRGSNIILTHENVTLKISIGYKHLHIFKDESLYFVLKIDKTFSELYVFDSKGKLFKSNQIKNKHIKYLQPYEIAEILSTTSSTYYGET